MPNLTDQDIKSIIEAQKEVFLTKDDAKPFVTKADLQFFAAKEDIGDLEAKFNEKFNKIITTLDAIAKNMKDYHQEATA